MTNIHTESIALGFSSKGKIKQTFNRSVTHSVFFFLVKKNTFT
jgi:hypothetical protein